MIRWKEPDDDWFDNRFIKWPAIMASRVGGKKGDKICSLCGITQTHTK